MSKIARERRKSQRWRRFRRKIRRFTDPLRKFWKWVEPAWPAALVLVVLVFVLELLRGAYYGFGNIEQGIYIEGWGTVFDIAIVGVILTLFAIGRDRKERIERYLDEIDDFKKWDSEEARLRIAGNIRRLAKLGKTDIDFSGIVLRDVSFESQDIESLKGATFSLGLRLDRMSKMSTVLENVDFSHVDCAGVVFSRNIGNFAWIGFVGKNLRFTDAKLNGACFDGAKLSWTDYKADKSDWDVYHGDDDEGRPMIQRVPYAAFAGADLKGCSFRYTELDHADFREAKNIRAENFTGAKGLETCFFDDDVQEQILAAAAKKPDAD